MKPNVELHIAELILHGFPPAERHRVGAAVERELTRLFVERGVPPSLIRVGEVSRLDGGAFEMKLGSGPEATGVRVARTVYGGLNR